MYRKRLKCSRKLTGMRAAKEQKRLETPMSDYPQSLPKLRRRIVIIDRDFGLAVHKIDLYKTDRIDCYAMFVDGELRHKRIGWAKVLAKVRLNFPRVKSLRSS